jgi:hypothetical protein
MHMDSVIWDPGRPEETGWLGGGAQLLQVAE